MNEEELAKGRRILELGKEIEQLPGFKLNQDIKRLDMSLFIFKRNFEDLRNIITFITTDPRGIALHTVENRNKRRIVGLEVIRGIYNYTAAAVSLVQHTILLYNSLYGNNNLFPDYHERVRKDFDPSFLTFLHDLRHYCQHCKVPVITFLTTGNSNGELVRRVVIPVKDLKEYLDWKAQAKRYLDSLSEMWDVLDVLTDFYIKELAFQKWFRTRQEEIHADEYKELDTKQDELIELMGDNYIPPAP